MRVKSTLGKTTAIAICMTLAITPAMGGSVAGFGGATEITQIMNNTQLIQQAMTMAKQLDQMIQSVSYAQQQLVNLKNLPNLYWGQISGDLNTVMQVVAQGQALGYQLSNLDNKFSVNFPGFRSPLGSGYSSQSQQWTRTNLDSIKASLKAAGMQSDQFGNEQSALAAMENQAASAEGSNELAQVGAQLAAQQVQQMMKLRQLMMAEMQAQNAVLATNEQRQSDVNAATAGHFQEFTPGTPTFSSAGGKH